MKYRDMNEPATQRERADARQVQNSAGGFVYSVSDEQRLRRFLVLGTEGGTFYASQKDLTKVNVNFLKEYAAKDPASFLNTLVDVDTNNVAPRHSTVLLALAVLYTHSEPVPTRTIEVEGQTRTLTWDARQEIEARFSEFVRTGTHLFEFVDYVTQWRRWGRSLRRIVGSWYKTKEPDALAYQVVKYRQRGGWSHRDLLRKAHPQVNGPLALVLDYVTHGPVTMEAAIESGKPTTINTDVAQVIEEFEAVKSGNLKPVDATALSWEMLPTEALTDPLVWVALIQRGNLPYTAMLRNLGRMTSIGVFNDAGTVRSVVARLSDAEYVKRARVHPFNVLTALKTYGSGGGFRGSLTWTPNQRIVDALDAAFYQSFGNVPATGKNVCIALDVSGSMGSMLMNSNVSAREGSVAMAMATLAADPDTTETIAFTSGGWSAPGQGRGWYGGSSITELGLSPRRRMDDIVNETSRLGFGGTDCSLPMLWAIAQKKSFDAFVVYTDNETWAGKVQPMDALRTYRQMVNPEARLIVVGMTATDFTIADPQDGGTLDVVGFDASAPGLISNFIAGRF
jgi:60 kDa SS-A/Ro ribonucleoprotein